MGKSVIQTSKRHIVLWGIKYVVVGMVVQWISLCGYAAADAPQSPNQAPLIPLTAGFDLGGVQLAEVSLKDIQTAWEVLYEKIAKESGVLARNKLYHDITMLVNDFNAGELDMVLTTALNYLRMTPAVETNRDPDIYGAVVGEQKSYHYLLVVRSDAGLSEISELQGASMYMKQGDTTGRFYVKTLLARHGHPETKEFFQAIKETTTFSQAVLAVFFHKGDACLTTQSVFETMVELNPQVGSHLTILESSPAFANPVLFFHQQLPQETKDLVIETLLNFETSVYGQQFLLLHKIDRLVHFEPSDLDSLSELLQEYDTYRP